VKNVATGQLYIAEKNQGAYLNNQQIYIPDVSAARPIYSISLGKNIDSLTQSISDQHIIRSLGSSSLEMCLVAHGAIDGYIVGKEYLRVTDIAASTLLVREAGGCVVDKYGHDLDMPLTLEARTSLIAGVNSSIVESILHSQKH
jgi:fructose-1,6-bisphosphatase/inositol monophosphatase family enzyme